MVILATGFQSTVEEVGGRLHEERRLQIFAMILWEQ